MLRTWTPSLIAVFFVCGRFLGLNGYFPVLGTFEPFDTNLILQRWGKVSPGSKLFQIIFSTRRAVGLE